MSNPAKALPKRLIEIPEMRRIQHLHFVGIGGGDMDRSSVHTGFYIHYVSDR